MPTKQSVESRFWTKVEKTENCWLWKGSRFSNGYGTIRIGYGDERRTALAHRLSYEMANGVKVDKDTMVLHRCDVRRCVNPEHLFLGTAKDNAQDCLSKGRNDFGCKLDEEKASEIRRLYSTGKSTYQDLADRFQINRYTVGKIVRREIWKEAE